MSQASSVRTDLKETSRREGIERRLLAVLRQCSSGVLRHAFVHSRCGRGVDDAERN